MRVLWFSSSSTGYTSERNRYNGGGWASSALAAIKKQTDIQIGVSFLLPGEPFKTEKENVTYYPMPNPPASSLSYKLRKLWAIYGCGNLEQVERESWLRYIPIYQRIIEDYHPDIIHVWGSEQRAGIVGAITKVPVVLHIQGILNPYYNASLPPSVSLKMSFSSRNPIRTWIQCRKDRADWLMGCFREQYIFSHVHHYMGRTLWDQSVTAALSPQANYFHCDEFLRDVFYQYADRQVPAKLTIVSTISYPLFKGYDMILKTASILKRCYNLDFEWKCFGNINSVQVEKITRIKHEDCNVRLMGIATPDELKAALLSATLYFHPSYIDNSPNSVCEAQMMGLPIVCTHVGGLSSIVSDQQDGYLVPANEPYMAAHRIMQLFADAALNCRMGHNSAKHAKLRHDREKITSGIISIYHRILDNQ